MTVDEFVSRMRSLEADHSPDGWPAIQMRDISLLLDIIERQREALGKISSSPVPITGGYTEKLIAIASTALSSEV